MKNCFSFTVIALIFIISKASCGQVLQIITWFLQCNGDVHIKYTVNKDK